MTIAAPTGPQERSERPASGRRRKRSRASAIATTLLRQPFQPLSASDELSSTPEPPFRLPAGRVVHVPGRGEFFVRDSAADGGAADSGVTDGGATDSGATDGGATDGAVDGTPVLLLHGWTVSADLNWYSVYRPLVAAGYRVLAMDHRGHGRGLRSPRPFRLADCADDAAALLDELGVGPALVVGYSMGGPIAQLMARDHADAVIGIVLCATSTNWGGPWMRVVWSGMTGLRLALGLAPRLTWSLMLGVLGTPATANAWLTGELSRGSSIDIAEAGRELGRYDSRPWIGDVTVPAEVIVTSRDNAVPPYKQRDLARRLSARRTEIARDHDAAVLRPAAYVDALLDSLGRLGARTAVRA